MARLHEYQGKNLLRQAGVGVPAGKVVKSAEDAVSTVSDLGESVVLKAQVWTTSRAAQGGIRFADGPEDVAPIARELLGLKLGGFPVDRLLVEQKVEIAREMFLSIYVDDSVSRPVLLFAPIGGSGIEEILGSSPDKVVRRELSMLKSFRGHEARSIVRQAGFRGKRLLAVSSVLVKAVKLFRSCEARSLEINPLVETRDGRVLALDCRIAVDDYAVFRHPELGIEIARELSRPPSRLDRIAYDVEKNDYRGTFYFIEFDDDDDRPRIAFHGAGGGGSMMSMDAAKNEGFCLANFTDTSGNPPASKVYRAARIMLAQSNIVGYFGSGSGVASQEQYNSARGLVKAFLETPLTVPAVVRLGGNCEDEAVELLEVYTSHLPVPVEGYKSDDSAAECAQRLRELVDHPDRWPLPGPKPRENEAELVVNYGFDTVTGGRVDFDHDRCFRCPEAVCITACRPGILTLVDGVPRLKITPREAARGKCTECLACEQECFFRGENAVCITLPIPGLDT